MRISDVSEEYLLSLSPKQKWEIIFGDTKDDGECADIAILLGTKPGGAAERALAAAELYLSGRASYIVPSGGVEWDIGGGEMLSEALYMKRILIENGVPEEAIILENEARTTKENMIYATLQINRRTKFYSSSRIAIVSSAEHMKRSLALAKTFLPRMVSISSYPAPSPLSYEEWTTREENISRMDRELHLIFGLVVNNIIDDFELPME